MTVTGYGNWLLAVLAAAMWVFTIRYAFWSRWWTNRVGRVFLPEKVIMSTALTQVALSALTSSSYPGRDWARIVVYGLGALSLIVMTVLLVRIQRSDQPRPSRGGEGHERLD